MQTLAAGRAALVAASLLLALASCAHRGASGPKADPFFTLPPPQGVLTSVPIGPGDRPPPRLNAAHPAAHAPDSAAARATATAPPAGTAATAPAAATASAAATAPAVLTTKTGENVLVDELPVAITRVPPSYPDAAREKGVQGTVQLQVLVKTDGTVGDVRVTVSVPGLDDAAKACVRQWKFKPGMTAGKPVEAWVGIPVHFSIH